MAVFPLVVVDFELARGADPGAHDLAAVGRQVGVQVHGVRVAPDAFPLGRVHDRGGAGFTQHGDEIGHGTTPVTG